MIKTKEDMRGCYVAREDKELFELFMDKCEEFGIRWTSGAEPRSLKWFSYVIFGGVYCDMLTGVNTMDRAWSRYRRLTKEDFIEEPKVKTKVEYTKITASIFDLRDEFEAGRIYRKLPGGNLPWRIASEVELARAIASGEAYLCTDRAMTWHDECVEYLTKTEYLTDCSDLSLCVNKPASDDEDDLKEWKELQQEFIGLCKIVAKAHEDNN